MKNVLFALRTTYASKKTGALSVVAHSSNQQLQVARSHLEDRTFFQKILSNFRRTLFPGALSTVLRVRQHLSLQFREAGNMWEWRKLFIWRNLVRSTRLLLLLLLLLYVGTENPTTCHYHWLAYLLSPVTLPNAGWFFSIILSSVKFSSLKISLHLKRVATLPCEMFLTFLTHGGQWPAVYCAFAY